MLLAIQMNRRGVETSWILVGMILALIVLAVMAYIFWSQARRGQAGLEALGSCAARGGRCISPSEQCSEGELSFPGFGCPPPGEADDRTVCCIAR